MWPAIAHFLGGQAVTLLRGDLTTSEDLVQIIPAESDDHLLAARGLFIEYAEGRRPARLTPVPIVSMPAANRPDPNQNWNHGFSRPDLTTTPIPRRPLGRTGQPVTNLGLGGEGVLRTHGREAAAVAVIQRALGQGVKLF